jgi:hypothetical protein
MQIPVLIERLPFSLFSGILFLLKYPWIDPGQGHWHSRLTLNFAGQMSEAEFDQLCELIFSHVHMIFKGELGKWEFIDFVVRFMLHTPIQKFRDDIILVARDPRPWIWNQACMVSFFNCVCYAFEWYSTPTLLGHADFLIELMRSC